MRAAFTPFVPSPECPIYKGVLSLNLGVRLQCWIKEQQQQQPARSWCTVNVSSYLDSDEQSSTSITSKNGGRSSSSESSSSTASSSSREGNSQSSSSQSSGSSYSDSSKRRELQLIGNEPSCRFQEAFNLFDKDRDGSITARDVGAVMGLLGHEFTEADLHGMSSEEGADGNGKIGFSEFLRHVVVNKNGKRKHFEKEHREAFRVFDKDESGLICASKLRNVMNSLGQKVTDEEVDDMIREADFDGDGHINYDEFLMMMTTMNLGARPRRLAYLARQIGPFSSRFS